LRWLREDGVGDPASDEGKDERVRFMTRFFDPPTFTVVRPGTVSFIQKLASSNAFKEMFKEGMGLVEEAAAYLDGPGREESRQLRRPAALAYATESMRLTTRLMQIASWLLLQRAVNEGEMTLAQAATDKHRVRLTRQDIACASEIFEELPTRLRALSSKSLRLQARVMHLDRCLFDEERDLRFAASPIESQVARLREAFQPQAAVGNR
jgi:regulator of CtrA degradation